MNIPKEHIKLLRGNIESVMQGLNSLGNILILAEEEDELTEQCGVNTSNSFNTPPMDDYVAKPFTEPEVIPGVGKTQTPDPKFTPKSSGELDPETWKCNEPDDGGRHPQGIPHFAEETVNKRMAEKEQEPEPRKPTPVERLFDYISEAFTDEHCQTRPPNDTKNWYPNGMSQLCAPSHLHHLLDNAQDFLDNNARLLTPGMRERQEQVNRELAKRVEELEEKLDLFRLTTTHELGHILLQRMHEDDIEEVVNELRAKLHNIVGDKTD